MTNRNGTTLSYDAQQRLSEHGTTEDYVYTTTNQRLIRQVGGVRTLYLPGMEVTVSGTTRTINCYVTVGATPVATKTVVQPAGASMTVSYAWSCGNLQSSNVCQAPVYTTAVTPTIPARKRYTPYGGDRNPVTFPNTDRGFLNQPEDANGLVYLNNRYHDPTLGHFISVDPLVGKTGQPYLYANGSPATLSDPSGLDPGWAHDNDPCNDAGYYSCKQTTGCAARGRSACKTSSVLMGLGPRGVSEARPVREPATLDVPSPAKPAQAPTGPESAACQHSGSEADVNCFDEDGTNGNGATQTPFESAPNLIPGSLGFAEMCLVYASECAQIILRRSAEMYKDGDVESRNILLTPFTPAAAALIDGCPAQSAYGQGVCTGLNPRAAVTVGQFLITDHELWELDGEYLWHESVHMWQQAAATSLGLSPVHFLAVYTAADSEGTCNNVFEVQANVSWGRYSC